MNALDKPFFLNLKRYLKKKIYIDFIVHQQIKKDDWQNYVQWFFAVGKLHQKNRLPMEKANKIIKRIFFFMERSLNEC